MIDQELIDFNEKVVSEVITSFTEGESDLNKTEVFTSQCFDIIADSLNIYDPVVREFSFSSKNDSNLDISITGFSIEEDMESEIIVHLTSTLFFESEVGYVTKKEFLSKLRKVIKFSNDAIKGHLQDVDEGMLGDDLKRLCDYLLKMRNNISRIKYYFFTNHLVKDKTKQDLPEPKLDDYTINYEIVDLERLQNVSNLDGGKEPLSIDFTKETDFEIKCLHPEMSGYADYECYLAVLPGKLLSDLYSKYHTRLLQSNVRVFLQQGGNINKGIKNTIIKEPKMFLAYNNGITATADQVELNEDKSKILSVRNFQIVNGGQTTASLYYTLTKDKSKIVSLDDIYLQLKLTVVKKKDQFNKIVSNISRYANSQNKVTEMDLSSNNIFWVELEKLSRSIHVKDKTNSNLVTYWYFERVNKQYKESENRRKTTVQKNDFKRKFPYSQLFLKSQVAKCMNIYHIKPAKVSKNNANFSDYIENVIEKTFNEKQLKPSKEYYEDLIANIIIYKTSEKSIYGSKKDSYQIGDTNLRAPVIVYSLSLIHEVTENRVDLKKIFDEQKLDEELVKVIRDVMIQVYDYFNKKEGLASMIARNAKTFGEVKSAVSVDVFGRLKDLLIDKKEATERIKKHRIKNVEDDIGDDVYIKMTQLGVRFWDGLMKKGGSLLNDFDELKVNSILQKFIGKRKLTKQNLIDGNKILNEIEEFNIDVEEVSSNSFLVENMSKHTDKAVVLFKNMDKKMLKDLTDLGRSGNQKLLSSNDVDKVRKVFEEVNRGKIPDNKKVDAIFPKVETIVRRFIPSLREFLN